MSSASSYQLLLPNNKMVFYHSKALVVLLANQWRSQLGRKHNFRHYDLGLYILRDQGHDLSG